MNKLSENVASVPVAGHTAFAHLTKMPHGCRDKREFAQSFQIEDYYNDSDDCIVRV